jgi:hypothetical protein
MLTATPLGRTPISVRSGPGFSDPTPSGRLLGGDASAGALADHRPAEGFTMLEQ